MSDPAVCCFLTRALCAQGGRLGLPELQQHAGLSAPQLAETLAAAGPRRFLVLRGGAEVLAVSDVRVCARRECGGCERLHLCKLNLMGRCHMRPSSCKYSHDITSAENKKVLKKHDLSGLSEDELRILLLQNDAFFLPDVSCTDVLKEAFCSPGMGEGNRECGVLISVSTLLFIQSSHAGPGSTLPGQRQQQLPTGAGGKDEDKKDDSSAEASKDNKEVNCDEICVFYVWKYCKHKDKCKSVHYHLPYKWEIYDGITWKDLSMMEEIEKAYCDPKNSSIAGRNINFQTMTCSSSPVRRLSTPSSVTKPTFVLTTQWIWYWKNNEGQWIEYGEQGEGDSVDSPSSAVLENLYQADPDATISFQAGQHHYNLNFKEMTQTNIAFKTRREVCRRPKFVSSEDKERPEGFFYSNQACPSHWDQSALPDLGYKAVVISSVTSEYNAIKQLFHQTMKTYSILKIQRIQNPSLWKVFQWQKEKMKRENGGKEVQEKLLFHGTNISFMEAICTRNFDWRICGKNGSNYGMGSYFARDASYSHAYCQAVEKGNMMFVARVLVGDYIKGNAAYVRPPRKSADGLWFYDSCVDDELNPSVFVVFEKHQIYPEYIIEYKEDEKKCVIS
ncbi:PREDICTED: LOW QUALITY PROTEIN: zinc finger CCCH-type antiviral protein 1-like [Lepidothrix coronata]|uniref:LOW QUALITY PROTEIN: zinc finger CCCH-type antiviral protein 1-like n=1 Tax=Lepidothrix coronata TaxID=321398 RepID=A0A6J0I5U5_9PASS|nr:PREDICTED: LOW QUALITY PROTEIN: zinc finger CCCH-type antiviral protein 1-like [Lepidothrix coronata]